MAHWRDGGIGNMPGSDDRPIEEWTLLERLSALAAARAQRTCTEGPRIAQAAFDEIQRLRGQDWQLLDTAPVEPGHTVSSYYRFRCMLQDADGYVYEGAAYYVKLGRATTHLTLRWQNAMFRQVFPKFWRPLPLPKVSDEQA